MSRSLQQVGGTLIDGFLRRSQDVLPGGGFARYVAVTGSSATLTTAGAGTLTAALLSTGWVRRDPNGAPRVDTTSTAALLLSDETFASMLPQNGSMTRTVIENTGEAAETITLAAGAGVTLSAPVIPAGGVCLLEIVRASAPGATAAVVIRGRLLTGLASPAPEAPAITAATVTTIATADAVTYTAAQIAGGVIRRDPAGGARADLVDTAANLIAALGLTANGMSRECLLVNTADAAETITVTTNTGVTVYNTATVAQTQAVRLVILRTSGTTVDVLVRE